MPLRIALLGAGAMGALVARDVYPALRSDVEVVAVIDRDRDRAAAVAAPLGAIASRSLAAAIDVGVQGVDIRLPHAAHRDAALEALDAGLHVLVEKPLAASVDGARDIVRASPGSDRVLGVTENYPHLRSVRAAASAIAAGAVGEVLAIRTTRAYTLGGVWTAPWRRAGEDQSGILWDQATHHTSLLRVLGGDVVSVAGAATGGRASDRVESVALTLRLASGVVAQAGYTWGTPAVPVETEAVVLGTTGRLHVDVDYDGSGGGATLIRADGTALRLSDPECYYDSHRWVVEDWLAAIRDGRPPRVTAESAFRDVQVVDAARRSIEEGGAVIRIDEEALA